MTHPTATYRLQLSASFPFSRAAQLVGYLAQLGVSHVYCSPVLRARPGSEHFYDVADHGEVDPVLGGEDGLRELADAAHGEGLGLIGDIVAHHMGIGPWAPLWERLLREGRSSEVAKFFDIDWESPLPGAKDKVILPVLQRPYGEALAAGDLRIPDDGERPRVTYHDLSFPLAEESVKALERLGVDGVDGEPGQPRSWLRMHSLLEQQHYRLVSARAGVRLVNYRRYKHSDQLAAVRVEDDSVFDHTHAKMIELVRDGVFDGLRIDHVDGLADPTGYLAKLRDRVGPDAWLIVESFTTPERGLPADWPVQGTTGYENLRTNLGLQVEPAGLRQLRGLAADADGLPGPRDRWRMKADMLDQELGPDLRRCARLVWQACQEEVEVRDVDYRTLLEAVSRLATSLHGYRTYVDPATGECSPDDERLVSDAVDVARNLDVDGHDVPEALWGFLHGLLTGTVRWSPVAGEAVTRFQQLTGPVTALGEEERLFHRHQALVAGCELGCDPDDVPRTLQRAHAEIEAVPRTGMRTTATHDTLLGEDVRMRIAALTGMAGDWTGLVPTLVAQSGPPDQGLGLRLLQVAVGAWPIDDDGRAPLGEVLQPQLVDRFIDHARTVARKQARQTTFRQPQLAFESALEEWCREVLAPDGPVAAALRPIAVRAAEMGMAASLSQTLMRLTAPGIPDTYQGTEWWDDSLSDPDNRRPVDFDARRITLRGLGPTAAGQLWEHRRDGRVKQHVVHAALQARAARPDSFAPTAAYTPMEATGRWAEHLLVFSRAASPTATPDVVVVAPRAFGRVTDGGRFDPRGRIWADTDLVLPGQTRWVDQLTGHTVGEGTVAVADLLHTLPVSLLFADHA